MKEQRITDLLRAGAYDRLRRDLKRLAIRPRMEVLSGYIPHIKSATTESHDFFRKHFSIEIGSIVTAVGDLEKAESLYRSAK
jgi:hypothetical protein